MESGKNSASFSKFLSQFFWDRLETQARHFVGTGSILALYAGGIVAGACLGIRVASLVARVSPFAAALVVIAFAILGFCLGTGLAFAAGAFWMRITHRAKPLDHAIFREVFAGALPIRLFEVNRAGQTKLGGNVVVAGFAGGRGIFMPGVFVDASVLATLSSNELRAVLAHERAHLESSHLRARVTSMIAHFIGSAFFTTLAIVGLEWMGYSHLAQSIGIFAGAVPVAITVLGYRAQMKRHELEADSVAVARYGADPMSLVAALTRLSGLAATKQPGLLRDRIAALEALVPIPAIAHEERQNTDARAA